VLKDATAEIHGVTRAEAPPVDEPDPEIEEDLSEEEKEEYRRSLDREPHDYWHVDVTITPSPSVGKFTHWEPGELMIVAEDKVVSLDGDNEDDETGIGYVNDLDVWLENKWTKDEGFKFQGPMRLRLRVGMRPGTRSFKFQYYFESFGRVTLPR
jgi:hypothetical protein